ncbi:MAG: hypothetical protein H6618_04530 [Deltaproteobacteria bacterium]|nr:hypothetical protein [Deltaproteobacteria bacterium]
MKTSKLLKSVAAANLLLIGTAGISNAETKNDSEELSTEELSTKDFKVETISEGDTDFSPAHNCCGCGGGTCNTSC